MTVKLCRLSTLLLAAILGGMSAVQAQAATHFSLPSQPLADALRALGTQTNTSVVFDPKLVDGVRAPALEGDASLDEALTKLLAGTGITHQFLNDKTVILELARKSEGKSVSGVSPSEAGLRVAQENAADAGGQGDAKGKEEAGQGVKLEEVVVTAQKRKEILKDVPISISVLSGGSLDSSTFTGVMEALRTVPGVSTQPGAGVGASGSIQIRGVTPGAGSQTIGYYLDGAPFSLIRFSITPDQNSFDLERVEVLRGPQGTLYGASAESGLVRVLTKNADLNKFEFKARSTLAQTEGADSVNYRGDVALNVPLIEGKLAARAVLGYDSTGGWIDTPVKNGSNSTRTRTYRLKINAQPTDQLSIGLSSWMNRGTQDAGILSDDNWRRGFPDANTIPPGRAAGVPEPLLEDYEVHNLQVTYDFSAFTLSSSTGYLDWDGIGTIDYSRYFIFDPNMTTSVVYSRMPSRSISQEVVLNSASGSSWKWTAGAMYRDIRAHLYQSWPGVIAQPISFVDTSKSEAVFGQVSRRFGGNKFEWTLGARYFKDAIGELEDDIAVDPATGIQYTVKRHYSATTPRAVLTWYPSGSLTMYASYAQGFRSGLPQDYAAGLSTPGLPDAQPDKLNNYEVGAKFDLLDRRLSFDVAAYYMDWTHVIGTFPIIFQNTLVQGLANGTSASGPGVDFSIVARPARGLELGLSTGWNDLKQDTDVVFPDVSGTTQVWAAGDRLAGSPEMNSTAFVNLERPLGASGYRGTLSISASYTSSLQTFLPGALPAGRTVLTGDDLVFGQASLAVEAPSGWRASLFVDNFTNEKGKFGPSAYYFTNDYLSHYRPRTVGVQFEYRYGR